MRLAIIDVIEERGRILLEMTQEVFLQKLEKAFSETHDIKEAFNIVAEEFKRKTIAL